jgi:hypothetical protein
MTTVPWGKCLRGLGAANPQPLTPAELNVIERSKIEAFKMLTLPDADENKTLIEQLRTIRPDMLIVARLFFSADLNNKTHFSPLDFTSTVNVGFEACYAAGLRYFEIHNEPNLDIEGNGWNWHDGAEFGKWLSQVISILKSRHSDVQLGYPGLSPQSNTELFLSQSEFVVRRCDWVGVHNYWQQPAGELPYPIDGPRDGALWRAFRTMFPNQMIMLAEFSNTSAAVPAQMKGKQYANYYNTLRHEPNIGAAFAFALSWPDQDEHREGWTSTPIANIVGAMDDQRTVTPLSQRDRKWASTKLGTSASTIGGEGCALMCTSMLLSYLSPDVTNLDPLTLNSIFIHHGVYRLGNLMSWSTLPTVFPQLVYHNRTDCPRSPAPIAEIDARLEKLPLIVYVNFNHGQANEFKQHFILLVNREDPDNYAVADPWTGELTTLCPRYGSTPAQAICGIIWMDRS